MRFAQETVSAIVQPSPRISMIRGFRVTIVSPVSTAVSAMNADRHQHHQHRDESQRATTHASDLTTIEEAAADAAFVAAPAPEPQALKAISAGRKPWAPPQSELNLRDRTV